MKMREKEMLQCSNDHICLNTTPRSKPTPWPKYGYHDHGFEPPYPDPKPPLLFLPLGGTRHGSGSITTDPSAPPNFTIDPSIPPNDIPPAVGENGGTVAFDALAVSGGEDSVGVS